MIFLVFAQVTFANFFSSHFGKSYPPNHDFCNGPQIPQDTNRWPNSQCTLGIKWGPTVTWYSHLQSFSQFKMKVERWSVKLVLQLILQQGHKISHAHNSFIVEHLLKLIRSCCISITKKHFVWLKLQPCQCFLASHHQQVPNYVCYVEFSLVNTQDLISNSPYCLPTVLVMFGEFGIG